VQTITLRPAIMDDAGTLVDIMATALGEKQRERPVLAMQARLERPHSWSQLACTDNQILGFVIGHTQIDEAIADLDLLMILPQHAGHGIGSTLLDWVAKKHRSGGRKYIELWVNGKNDRARRLYERHDYKVVRRNKTRGSYELCYRLTL